MSSRHSVSLIFVLSAAYDPLYDGRHMQHGRFMTYGQQAFVYDFVRVARRLGFSVAVVIEDRHRSPIAAHLEKVTAVFDLTEIHRVAADGAVVVFDAVTDGAIRAAPAGAPALAILHDAGAKLSDTLVSRCARIICMSATAMTYQTRRIAAEGLLLINQGVDLDRFRPGQPTGRADRTPRVLIYGRLDGERGATLERILDRLARERVDLTVLGSGERFWLLGDAYGADITLIANIPCFCIHRVLGQFDIVVSSGRGVMESLGCGIPVLCAGYAYSGLVTATNVEANRSVNMTGYGLARDIDRLHDDIEAALVMDRAECRRLAETFFSMDRFVLDVVAAAEAAAPEPRPLAS